MQFVSEENCLWHKVTIVNDIVITLDSQGRLTLTVKYALFKYFPF